MKKFNVKLVRQIDLEVEAESGPAAKNIADDITAQFPADTCRVLSIIEEGVQVEIVYELKDRRESKNPRGPKPDPSGGSPQTPALPVQMDLVDQIAEAA